MNPNIPKGGDKATLLSKSLTFSPETAQLVVNPPSKIRKIQNSQLIIRPLSVIANELPDPNNEPDNQWRRETLTSLRMTSDAGNTDEKTMIPRTGTASPPDEEAMKQPEIGSASYSQNPQKIPKNPYEPVHRSAPKSFIPPLIPTGSQIRAATPTATPKLLLTGNGAMVNKVQQKPVSAAEQTLRSSPGGPSSETATKLTPQSDDSDQKKQKVESLYRNLIVLCSNKKQHPLMEKFLKVSKSEQCLELLRKFQGHLDLLTVNEFSLDSFECLVLKLFTEPLALIETKRVIYQIIVDEKGSDFIIELLKRQKIFSFLISLIKPNVQNLAKSSNGAKILKFIMSGEYGFLQQTIASKVFEEPSNLVTDKIGHEVFLAIFDRVPKAERWPIIERNFKDHLEEYSADTYGLKTLEHVLRRGNPIERKYLCNAAARKFLSTPAKMKSMAEKLSDSTFCQILCFVVEIVDVTSKEKVFDICMENIEIVKQSSQHLIDLILKSGRKIAEPTIAQTYAKAKNETEKLEIIGKITKNLSANLNDPAILALVENVLVNGSEKEMNKIMSEMFTQLISTEEQRKHLGTELGRHGPDGISGVCSAIYCLLEEADETVQKVWIKLLVPNLQIIRSSHFMLYEKVRTFAMIFDPSFAKKQDQDMRLNFDELNRNFHRYINDDFALEFIEQALRKGDRKDRLILANAAFQALMLGEERKKKFENEYLKNPKICRILCHILDDVDQFVRRELVQVLVRNIGVVRLTCLALYDKIDYCDIRYSDF